ncbi:DUF4328 domain-containing protein [Crossiella sp. CA-258035]|uniref:DUF4328 domain-containing protein n=1 Tax=Crossiella sp. CA-258035 TaxID=2981138 RepID=UPI0024BD1195|nr:DUF4328 domain-containing protein [Crossiella sp. CA-258035]WHT23414.1 DUF4328 domain-containing protein [Crossiella sp. CA-258035]
MQPMRVDWVASPPVPLRPYRPRRPEPHYSGPPAYPAPPRWGFPALTWRWPTAVPGADKPVAQPVDRMRALAGSALPLFWITGAAAAFTAAAELLRYILLLVSRNAVLPAGLLHTSDALVVTGGVITPVSAALAALVGILWLLRARQVAGELTGTRPDRPNWQVVAGLLIPGVNLLLPGATLAELEHTILEKPPAERPKPSRELSQWWLIWAVSLLVSGITLLWSLRTGVQAQADGVLWHLAADALLALVAIRSARLLKRYNALLAPVNPATVRRFELISVRGAELPLLPRRERPKDAVR